MSDRVSRRSGAGWTPLHRLPLPPGSPPRLRVAARTARVREALGAELGARLESATWSGRRLKLTFSGPEWVRALRRAAPDLGQRLARALGLAELPLEIRSRPGGEDGAAETSRPVSEPGGPSPGRRRRRCE